MSPLRLEPRPAVLKPVVLLCVSDVHLSLRPPLARAGEKDWKECMKKALDQVKALSDLHRAPIVVAGDVFDRWDAPAELINWAIDNFPLCYGIPGNHDLPSHRADLEHRSAYGALVRAEKITELGPDPHIALWQHKAPMFANRPVNVFLYGRPFGGKIPKSRLESRGLHVLLVHEYLWVPGHNYTGAPEESRLDKTALKFDGFDVVVVGDNHLGFERKLASGTRVINCGTLLRRKSSEVHYRPHVGMIHSDGSVSRHPLDIEDDVITETVPDEVEEADEELSEFVAALSGAAESLDFREALVRHCRDNKVNKSIRELILEALEKGKK